MNLFQYISENFNKIMELFVEHFFLFLFSIIITTIIGVALSIIATEEGREKMGKTILSITGAAQAVPSIAVIALVFIYVGIGKTPTIISLIIYSLVPVIFNATSGILSVPRGVIEAGKGMGFTKQQILWKLKIPIAIPVIMGGIRSAATIIIGTAVIASVIGGGGLGDLIFTGLKLNRPEALVAGAASSAIMAIIIDRILAYVEKIITPKGLKAEQ
ncbi:MAG TPA: ABC transporter permease [Candidatus Atribacteria bacterium]|jgi:osmoprotectant transport system permease protein|nr:ABC transporter permease [Candidatus Atribacteria bacterium]